MELNAHWYEFGSLSQLLSPERRKIFRRINFEYLLLFNQRSAEEMQAVIWNGIRYNLDQMQSVAASSGHVAQSQSATMTAPPPEDIAFQQAGEETGTIITPVQAVDIHPKPDPARSQLPLSGVAISHEVHRQAIDDIREAISGDTDHSKWLLIAAFKQLHKAVLLDPGNYSAHFSIAWLSACFFHKQQQAINHLDAVVQGAVESETPIAIFALRHLAEVQRELGNFDAAVEATNDAYMLDRQQTPQIIFDLARYLTLAEQHTKAVHFLEALLEQYPIYYWQVLAEPDFSKNQEVAALTNALARTYLGFDNILPAEPSEPQFDESDLVELLEENERINREESVFIPDELDLTPPHFCEAVDEQEDATTAGQPIVVRQTDLDSASPTDQSYANGHTPETDTGASGDETETAFEKESVDTAANDILNNEESDAETAAARIDHSEAQAADPETENDSEDAQLLENMLNEVEDIVEQESKKTDRNDGATPPGPPQTDMPVAPDETIFSGIPDTVPAPATREDRTEILNLLQQIGENLNLSPATGKAKAAVTDSTPDGKTDTVSAVENPPLQSAFAENQQEAHIEGPEQSNASGPEESDSTPDGKTDTVSAVENPPLQSALAENQQEAHIEATEQSNASGPEESDPVTAKPETAAAPENEPAADRLADTDNEDQYETNPVLAKLGKKILVEPPEVSWPNPFKIQEPAETLAESSLPDPVEEASAAPMSDLLMKVEENALRAGTVEATQQTANDLLNPSTDADSPAVTNGRKTIPADQPENLADIIAELHHEAELAFQQCEKLDTVFTRRDKERTQDKIQKMVEHTIRELPPLGEMERQKLLKISQQRIRQSTKNFLKRHKLVGKIKGSGN